MLSIKSYLIIMIITAINLENERNISIDADISWTFGMLKYKMLEVNEVLYLCKNEELGVFDYAHIAFENNSLLKIPNNTPLRNVDVDFSRKIEFYVELWFSWIYENRLYVIDTFNRTNVNSRDLTYLSKYDNMDDEYNLVFVSSRFDRHMKYYYNLYQRESPESSLLKIMSFDENVHVYFMKTKDDLCTLPRNMQSEIYNSDILLRVFDMERDYEQMEEMNKKEQEVDEENERWFSKNGAKEIEFMQNNLGA